MRKCGNNTSNITLQIERNKEQMRLKKEKEEKEKTESKK